MKNNTVIRTLGALVAAGALALAGAPAAYAASGGAGTCTGGEVSGTYTNLTIAGACDVPLDATLHVTGNLTIRPGAMLDAQSASSTVVVGRNVTAGAGSMLGLGCQSPESVGNSGHPCTVDPDGVSSVWVGGNITATGAMAVLLNGIVVKGNVTLVGGGGPIPWTLKNSTVSRNVTMSGQTTDWIGVLFNTIGRNATFTGITITDPDGSGNGMFIGHNEVGHNLNCSGISPKVSGGFGAPGQPSNTAGHNITGQCVGLTT